MNDQLGLTTVSLYLPCGKNYPTPKYSRRCRYCNHVFKTLRTLHIHQSKNQICKDRDSEYGTYRIYKLATEEVNLIDLIPKVKWKR